MMNIVIVGQGAMGLLWHYHLQAVTPHVATLTLLPSKVALKVALKKVPLHRLSRQAATNKQAKIKYNYTHLHGLSEQCCYQITQNHHINNADIILLCVKSYQVKQVVADISAKLNEKAIIILAHNGMGTLADIDSSVLQQHTILALLTTHGCARPQPKHIIHTGSGNSDLGLLSGELSESARKNITQLFHQALTNVHWYNNIIKKQWLKLAINCVINPLTAINNINNGKINSTHFIEIKTTLVDELIQVASAEHYQLNKKELLTAVEQVANATAKNCSSMRADVIAKRITEIDYINGYIHRLGLKHSIVTPANTQLWQQIKRIEAN